MPTYSFKCPACKKITDVMMSISHFDRKGNKHTMVDCINKRCGCPLYRKDQIINFEGAITGITPVTQVKRKYSNKVGGPKPIIDGKIRNDLKMPTQS